MLFQVLCGFEPVFYTTHPNEEPNLIDTFIFHKCPLLTNPDYIGDSQSFSQNRSSITVTAILYFTSISTFSGGLAKSLSISFSSTPAIFAIVSLDMP